MTDAANIAATAIRHGGRDEALVSIVQGESISQFRNRALLAGAMRSPHLGMSRSEILRYSVVDALNFARSNDPGRERVANSLELEIHNELVKRYGGVTGDEKRLSVMLPSDVLSHYVKRDLNTSQAGAGGYLIDTTNAGPIDLALPHSAVMRFGAETLEGLQGGVVIPYVKTGPTAQTHSTETTATSASTPTWGQTALTPKDVSALTKLSGLLLKQTSDSVQAFLVRLLLKTLAAKIDQLALTGSSAAGEPLGILSTPGIGAVSGSSIGLTGVLGLQGATGNTLDATGGYVTTVATATTLATREKAAGSGMLWTGNLFEGELGGYRAMTTADMPSATLLYGNWSNLIVAGWGALAVQVNPFEGFAAGVVSLRAIHSIDIAVRNVTAFASSTSVS